VTTLAELADKAQNAISDSGASTWSQSLVEEWCVEAIRDYSQHFPRRINTTINTSADDRKYDLPADFRGIVSVEYPTGEDPPEYLEHRSYTEDGFWERDSYFDIIIRADVADVAELWISEKPSASETITVEYIGDHDLSLSSGDTITVPERHEHILIEFVIWRAWVELQGAEQQSPTSNSSLLMSQYASNADRAKRSYVEALARGLRSQEGKSVRMKWKFDKFDRIY
jgi:hypothetical protein